MYKTLRLSQSKISVYRQCPRKYKYRYIDKVRTTNQWPHLIKGNFAHDVLELWVGYLIDGKDPRRAMQKAYTSVRKQKDYKEVVGRYLDEIKPWLKQSLEDFEERRYIPLAAEQEVRFRYKNMLVVGRVDRIDYVNPNTIKIVDYKTTKDPKYLTDLQLGIYHMGVKYGTLKPKYGDKNVETAYVLLRHDIREQPYTFTIPDLDQFLDYIEETAEQIRTDTTWEPRPSHMCNYCDYFISCTQERESVDAWW